MTRWFRCEELGIPCHNGPVEGNVVKVGYRIEDLVTTGVIGNGTDHYAIIVDDDAGGFLEERPGGLEVIKIDELVSAQILVEVDK